MFSILYNYIDTVGLLPNPRHYCTHLKAFFSEQGLWAPRCAVELLVQKPVGQTLVPNGLPPKYPCLSFVPVCCKVSFLPWKWKTYANMLMLNSA